MFGHRFYGSAYFGPRYFGDGGGIPPVVEPEVVEKPAGRRRRGYYPIDDEEVIEIITRWMATHLGH